MTTRSPLSPSPDDSAGHDRATMPSPAPAKLPQVVSAVLWSFFGVRRSDAMRRDSIAIRPHQVILVGVALAASLVAGLVLVVHLIVSHAR